MIKGVKVVKEIKLEVGSDDLRFLWSIILSVVDVGLGKIFCADHLMDISLLKHFHFFRSADAAAERENTTKFWVFVGRWVSDSQRTIDAMAVLKRWIACAVVLIMARLAHVVGTEAAEESSGAAIHAFPVDLYLSMLFAGSLSGADFLEKAVLAHEVLRLRFALSVVCFLLAVDQSTEVGHFA